MLILDRQGLVELDVGRDDVAIAIGKRPSEARRLAVLTADATVKDAEALLGVLLV